MDRIEYPGKREYVNIISFPKCGRTWVQLMVGTYVARHFEMDEASFNPLRDLKKVSRSIKGLAVVDVHHDGSVFHKRPEQLPRDKKSYRSQKVVLLVRNPRDVVVSAFFERSKRYPARGKPGFRGSMSEFIRHEKGSLDTIIEFMNIWYSSRDTPKEFCVVKYEDIVDETEACLRRILNIIGIQSIDNTILGEVVEACSFQKMREIEKADSLSDIKLRPGDVNDHESYKVRRGIVNGYRDYLSSEDIEFMNMKISQKLESYYGYADDQSEYSTSSL